jgi:hypothetical protein
MISTRRKGRLVGDTGGGARIVLDGESGCKVPERGFSHLKEEGRGMKAEARNNVMRLSNHVYLDQLTFSDIRPFHSACVPDLRLEGTPSPSLDIRFGNMSARLDPAAAQPQGAFLKTRLHAF